MPSQPEISSQMLQQLAVVEPDLDTSIGTPIRKMVDVEAEVIAEAYIDQFFKGYQYDVDTLTGASLDDFLSIFGFTRFAAKRSTGTVTFARSSPATTNLMIPAGTAISTATSPPVVFTTIIPALLTTGAISVDIPIQATLGGLAGNVSPNAISAKITPLDGISTLSNMVATVGGTDAESDAAVRQRFKTTVFRGFTGTEQMFLGVALENPSVTTANVVGASKTHREQLQIIGGVGQSVIQSAKYIYPYNFVLGPNIDNGNILNPGVHYNFNSAAFALPTPGAPALIGVVGGTLVAVTTYWYIITWLNSQGESLGSTQVSVVPGTGKQSVQITWPVAPIGATSVRIYGRTTGAEQLLNTVSLASASSWIDTGAITPAGALPLANTSGVAPSILSLDSINCPDGIYDLQFDYVPAASRNDPLNGITNRVDVYANGQDLQQATETIAFTNGIPFTAIPGPFYNKNFVRADLNNPAVGNYLEKFTFTPITAPPASIIVGPITYQLGIDYYLINDQTNQGGTAHSYSGIEWVSVANGASKAIPANGTQIQLAYVYNAVPREVETDIRNWRLVGYDVWVHQANQALIDIVLVVILVPGYTTAGVMPGLVQALQSLMSAIGFQNVLQVSDIITAAGQVPGITAVRLATSTDNAVQFAVYRIASAGNTVQTYAVASGGVSRAVDAYFTDDTLPILNQIFLIQKAQNSFSQGA